MVTDTPNTKISYLRGKRRATKHGKLTNIFHLVALRYTPANDLLNWHNYTVNWSALLLGSR